MNIKKVRNTLLLFLTAIIWGVAFVAQSNGMNYVGPFTFVFTRFIIAGFALIPVIFLFKNLNKNKNKEADPPKKFDKKVLLIGGLLCGLALGSASLLQQVGIQYTTVGKAGFITAFYIIIVPIISIALGKKSTPLVWISVVIALFGLYFLCMTESFTIEQGDIFIILCALIFSFHILVVDYFSPKVDGIILSCIQFFVIALIAFIPMIMFEKPQFSQLLAAWQPILYAGLLSSAVGYTFQIIGQEGVNPTVASLIMSLESVVSVIAGLILLNENLSSRELIGCLLMFTAIILAQLPVGTKKSPSVKDE